MIYTHKPPPLAATTLAGFNCGCCGAFVAVGSYHACYKPQSPMPAVKAPHKCPACDGWGKRTKAKPGEAHHALEYYTPTACPACNGTGVVWEP